MIPKHPKVHIVLPVYNEENSLEKSLAEVHAFLTKHIISHDWRLIVVNNGSFDSTGVKAMLLERKYLRVKAMHLEQAGRGGALHKAALTSGADYLMYMDVDLSTELEAIPRMLEALDRGADIAVGSRHHPSSRITRRLYRDILSRSYNLMLKAVFRTKTFRDAQCGFKSFRLAALRPIIKQIRDHKWFFDTELLVLAEYAGLEVVEIPVRWNEDPCSKVQTPQVIVQCLFGMIRLKLYLMRSC